MPKKMYVPDLAIIPHDLDHQAIISAYVAGQSDQAVVRWINEANEGIKIEDVRSLIYELSFGMSSTEEHIFVLLHAESASVPAQNALLKTLEEPPVGVRLILTATSIAELLPTIVSRCQLVSELGEIVEQSRQAHSSAVQQLWQTCLDAQSYSDMITRTEELKDRDGALSALRGLISYVYEQYLRSPNLPSTRPTVAQITGCLQRCHECVLQLEQNCNVRLSVENCFFDIHDMLRAGSQAES